MPRNNLSDQIKWLLSAKPFIPPTTSLVAYRPEVPPAYTGPTERDSFVNEAVLHDAPDRVPPRQSVPTAPPCSDRTRQHPTGGDTSSDMARLRNTPGGGKPRLIMTEFPMQKSLSSWKTPRREEAADTARPPPSSSRGPTTAKQSNGDKIEAIDLTNDVDVPSSKSLQRLKPGKKRKSEEYEEDNRVSKSLRPAKQQQPTASPSRSNVDVFVPIDDFGHIPTSPPPPYSTTVPDVMEDIVYDDDDFGVRIPDSGDDEDSRDVMPQPAEKAKKRKPLSRVASDASIPPRKIGKQVKVRSPEKPPTRSPEKEALRLSPVKKVRHAVLDSEDEDDDFGNFVEMDFEPPSPLKEANAQFREGHYLCSRRSPKKSTKQELLISGADVPLHQSPQPSPRGSPQKSATREVVTSSLPIRSPVKSITKVPSSSQSCKHEIPSSPSKVSKPSTGHTSPRKLPCTQEANGGYPSSSNVPKEDREHICRNVADFIREEEGRLSQHLHNAKLDWKAACKAVMDDIEDNEEAHPDLKKKMEMSRSRKDATEKLISLIPQEKELSAQRIEVRRRMQETLENGDIPDGEKAARIKRALEDIQSRIYSLIEAAGLKGRTETPGPEHDDSSIHEIVVRSTQAVPDVVPVHATPSSNSYQVPQTQYVKQTQISVRDVWSPSNPIRFAGENEAGPIPLPPAFAKPSNPHPGVQGTSASATAREASHRIPETPPRRGSLTMHSRATHVSSGRDSFHTPDEIPADSQIGFDKNENLFERRKGTPSLEINEDEEFGYGLGEEDWDDEWHNVAENVENRPSQSYDWKGQRVGPNSRRQIVDSVPESSIARSRQRLSTRSPRKSQLNDEGYSFPWSDEVKYVMTRQFKLRGFRPGQLEAINTTLSGEHCFVLMPTGGGKSLCYQLPAVIRTGRTHGVTVVISPLLSLMEDQVNACQSRFKMQAALINGETSGAEKNDIMGRMESQDPQSSLQLLYVTPEMLGKSQRMLGAFKKLHGRGQLARVVIDEAHCVSQWGHDFRPDYKALGDVLRQFSGVPIIALTATATQLVQTDVMANLGIQGCRKFSQSFNRPNLSYEVREKAKNVVGSIAELILSKHSGQCGIVYCLARKTCENVAKKLNELGVRAHHYHAGMQSQERSKVQEQWQKNKYHVIVATIAFGMGIDKPDVRFVIHHSLPKSLEGYYQETGRAGRDGMRSECYLYYMYADSNTLRKMINDGDGDSEQKARQHDMLRDVLQYCENKSDCRRVQVLRYFSEKFRREDCHQTCDNCRSGIVYEEKDLTSYASAAVRLVQQVEKESATVLQCVDAFRGYKKSRFIKHGLAEFGYGKDLIRNDVQRLFSLLLDKQALSQKSVLNKKKFATSYVKLGNRWEDYAEGRKKVHMQVSVTPGRAAKKPRQMHSNYPSTNVSSPIRPPARGTTREYDSARGGGSKQVQRQRRAAKRPVVQDDEGQLSDEAFEPVRTAKPSIPKRNKAVARPLTVYERMKDLTDIQSIILANFVETAKAEGQKILVQKNLRNQPFSDTILREMGLDLPRDVKEMAQIPGIEEEKVKHFGNKFLPLIERTRDAYGDHLPPSREQAAEQRDIVSEEDEEDDYDYDDGDEMPVDPNHQLTHIVDLCTPEGSVASDTESIYGGGFNADDLGAEVDQYEEPDTHKSHHFLPTSEPRVEEFRPVPAAASWAKERNSSKPPLPERRDLPFKNNKHRRSSGGVGGGGGSSRAYAGVRKKGTAKKAATRKRSTGGGSGTMRKGPGGGGGGARGSGGGGGWSGIMAMPS